MRRVSIAARATAAAVVVAVVVASGLAYASEVGVAVVDTTAPTGEVSIKQGASAPIVINLSVTGSQAGTATFEVFRNWTLSGGSFTGSNPQEFVVPPRDGGDPATTFSTTGTISVAQAQPTGGPITLAIKAFDITNSNQSGAKLASGSASSYEVTVIPGGDTTPPVLSLPSDIVAQATGPGGAAVSYAASANDAVDGPVSITCTPASGSTFALGLTTVNCSATDAAKNVANGSFKINVVDTTPPTLSLPASAGAEATGAGGAAVSYAASATDAVSGSITPSCSPASGSTFALGQTTVNCSATDGAGNRADGSFVVTVSDTAGPTITVSDVNVEATGPSGAVVTYTASASDAVSGAVTPSCSPASGSTFPLGKTDVVCTAVDGVGNPAEAKFVVTVSDTTDPVLFLPDDIVEEATGPGGATVPYEASASDTVDTAVDAVCTPAPGSTFALGETTVNCSATDDSGNSAEGSFTVTVQDTTDPVLSLPADMVVEATGPGGATVLYSASANDTVDTAVDAVCTPASGSTFALGEHTVNCSATDDSGNSAEGSFTVTVQDTTDPVLTLPTADVVAEATGPGGAVVTYSASANDTVDSAVDAVCSPASGSTFALGEHTVNCSATDDSGNTAEGSFTVRVEDTTDPVLTLPTADVVVEATGPGGATVPYSATANDTVDSAVDAVCSPASGSTFALGEHTVNCSATDDSGNTAEGSFTVRVEDTTDPVLALPANIATSATSVNGAVVAYSASAGDVVDTDLAVVCSPASGSVFAPGQTTVNCSATDDSGNTAEGSFTVTVSFTFSGFRQPVDNKMLNGMKAGSTAPIKWQVPDGNGGYISSTSIVAKTLSGSMPCAASAPVDNLEEYATGSTTLRYDASSESFVYNWQSPKKPGTCYQVVIVLTDGTKHPATFQLK